MILLIIAAFVAGYLIGRAGPPVLAADEPTVAMQAIDADGLQPADGDAAS